jgi:phage gpG-like protein
MLKVTVRETISARLLKFASALDDKSKILTPLAKKEIPNEVDRQFRSNAWASLTARYALQKRKRFGNRPILVASGKGRESYRNGGRVVGDKVLFGSNLFYMRFHQTGTSKMTKRAIDTKFASRTSRSSVENYVKTARINSRL